MELFTHLLSEFRHLLHVSDVVRVREQDKAYEQVAHCCTDGKLACVQLHVKIRHTAECLLTGLQHASPILRGYASLPHHSK
jgi:hypothetical protein